MKARSLVLIALLNPICNCIAQSGAASSTDATNHAMKGVANSVIPVTLLTSREFWLSVIVLAFGLSVLLVQYSLLKNSNASANEVIKGLRTFNKMNEGAVNPR
ncbi:hypothetical protein [Paraburkholderia rhynchosiae]|uniref:hypothetical protein n=1 Tax=Paraburkholderia rhynchosiae TaxID=487049 RepID=UPI0011AF81AA|nr:hypothetical protein [Paraburkholderia rhynchosiae]